MKDYSTDSKPIYLGSRIIGRVKNNTFYKTIRSNHILHSPPGLALSVDSLVQAENAGATAIEIKDKELGNVYFSTISHFRRYSFDMQRGKFESQKCLPLSYWAITDTNVVAITHINTSDAPKVVASNETEAPVYSEIQLSLFLPVVEKGK